MNSADKLLIHLDDISVSAIPIHRYRNILDLQAESRKFVLNINHEIPTNIPKSDNQVFVSPNDSVPANAQLILLLS